MSDTETAGSTPAVDHRGLQVLGLDECLQRVGSAPLGRVAFHDRGDVVVLPVIHVVDGTTIAFRARWDSRLAAAIRDDSVAFEVDSYDPSTRTGWSVLVEGIACTVDDPDDGARLEELLGSAWEGRPEDSFWIRVRPDEVTGRRLVTGRDSCGCC